MKTLYERLKPEVLAKLQKEAELYPNTIEDLFNVLKKNYLPMVLNVYDAHTVCSYSGVNFGILELANLFES